MENKFYIKDEAQRYSQNYKMIQATANGGKLVGMLSELQYAVERYPGNLKDYQDLKRKKFEQIDICKIRKEYDMKEGLQSEKREFAREWIRNHLEDLLDTDTIKMEELNNLRNSVNMAYEEEIVISENASYIHICEGISAHSIIPVNCISRISPNKIGIKISHRLNKIYSSILFGKNSDFNKAWKSKSSSPDFTQMLVGLQRKPDWVFQYSKVPSLEKFNLSPEIRELKHDSFVNKKILELRREFIQPGVVALIRYDVPSETGIPVAEKSPKG